jgi:gamma-glutamyltranspeptidase/glutathione hydrolase
MKQFNYIFLIILSLNVTGYDRITGLEFASRSEVIATNGMAATSHPLATQTAISILKNGGNAIDAAIAANAVLGLVEPTGCGIGGDLFAIIWSADEKKLFGLNSSGPAPKNISINKLKQKGLEKIPPYGPLPVTVPGAVAGWASIHKKFGLLEFNKTPKKGEIFINKNLAENYKEIANTYGKSFYSGKIAENIVNTVNAQGGFFSMSDLNSFEPEWINPVSTNYRGYDVWELPPNGQGIAALQILNILERFDIESMGFGTSDYIHLFTEAKKVVYEDRAKYYADTNFSNIPVEKLISKEYANERSKLINLKKSSKSFNPGNLEIGDTIYLTVADSFGNMVSLIQSNYRGMGSGVVPDNTGFMLQDRGEMFSLDPNHMNSLMPGKRPFHTIIPAFVTKNDKPFISFGLMGGAMQPQGHAQIIVNLVDFKMNLQEAGDAPRIRHVGSSQPTGEKMLDGGYLSLEKSFDKNEISKLKKMGHKFQYDLGGFGGYQAIMIKDGVYYGASESRKDGHASGY